MTYKSTRRGFTQIKRVGQALPDNSQAKGYTTAFALIELLVVVLIIGILAAVALPQYKVAVEKAKALELISMVNAVHKAEELYYLANGTYTSNLTKLDLEIDVSYLRYLSVGIGDNPYVDGTAKNGLSYVYYQDHTQAALYRGRRECRVPLTNSDTLQKVCASLTKKTKREDGITFYFWLF